MAAYFIKYSPTSITSIAYQIRTFEEAECTCDDQNRLSSVVQTLEISCGILFIDPDWASVQVFSQAMLILQVTLARHYLARAPGARRCDSTGYWCTVQYSGFRACSAIPHLSI